MPWTSHDALRHTKAADTSAKQSRWAATANAILARTGNEASAIRIANSQVGEAPKVGASKLFAKKRARG